MVENWLGQRLGALELHLGEWRAAGDEPDVARGRREALTNAVASLVLDVVAREGIDACFVSLDGLILDRGGDMGADIEGLAALTQHLATPIDSDAVVRTLGAVQQLVLVGERSKLALFRVHGFAIGIISRTEVRLSATLSGGQ